MMILGINQMRISSYQCVSFVHVFHKNDFQAGFFLKKWVQHSFLFRYEVLLFLLLLRPLLSHLT